MVKKTLFFQIFPAFLIIIFIIVFVLGWYITDALNTFYIDETTEDLRTRAGLVRKYILKENLLGSKVLGSSCEELSKVSNARVTIIDLSGKVLADSDEDPLLMDNHSGRPEIIQAVKNGNGTSIRFSNTLKKEMMYYALPFYENDKVIAVVRLSLPLVSIENTIWKVQERITIGGVVIALLAALVSYFVSRRISKPLESIKAGAERFSKGEFDRKLYTRGTSEISSLAETLNTMAQQLDERIKILSRQRGEQEAMLRSMVEGVLAVDMDERIILINKAAAKFFTVKAKECAKKLLSEVIRNTALHKFVREVIESKKRLKTEIIIYQGNEFVLQVRGSALHDTEGEQIGILIVMNDITQFRRLENMRSEFVANVSHELKTPITSIKGFVETLQEGVVKEPEKARKFLDIIAKQTDRMNAMIDDLLNLSRIEQQKESADIQLSENRIYNIINDALQDCQKIISQKNILVEVDCNEKLLAMVNTQLLQQAITNLLDNSIKYSNAGSKINISVQEKKKKIIISIQDYGCGISKEHHPRLFERFYRVDKARSQKLGGTGLGLAIVKHIAAVHDGKVSVESEPDKGSTFFIILPKKY